MSTFVLGVVPPDENHLKKVAAARALEAAGIDELPFELESYFGGETPDEAGMVVSLPREAVTHWSDGDRSGREVDITKLPPGVKILRFVNSW